MSFEQAVQKPSSVAELKQFCKEEWDKIPPQWCETLTASNYKHLIAQALITINW